MNKKVRMRTKEAANYLAMAKSTLEKKRLTGHGPKFIKMGRSVVYDVHDLDEWAESQKFSSTSEFRRVQGG